MLVLHLVLSEIDPAGRPGPDCRGSQAALGRAEKGREVAVNSRNGRNRTLWERNLGAGEQRL
jgi:hypothetical protein